MFNLLSSFVSFLFFLHQFVSFDLFLNVYLYVLFTFSLIYLTMLQNHCISLLIIWRTISNLYFIVQFFLSFCKISVGVCNDSFQVFVANFRGWTGKVGGEVLPKINISPLSNPTDTPYLIPDLLTTMNPITRQRWGKTTLSRNHIATILFLYKLHIIPYFPN